MDTPAGRVAQDETIRAGTTVEKLAGLKAVFETEELSARFPQIQWNTTAATPRR
ncbi:3-ketoacyl-CoA thiolase [Alicycliphilus sp. B1]|nr:3-ketoacyl-CoA thiolase [Alicycliphilus sp. B1]